MTEECNCYTCRYSRRKEPKVIAAYLTGYKSACEWFLNWAKRNNIKMGSMLEDTLEGIYSQIDCNHSETCEYIASLIQEHPEVKEYCDV